MNSLFNSKLVLNVWNKEIVQEILLDIRIDWSFQKQIFPTPVVGMQFETITDWGNFTIFSHFWHCISCIAFSRSRGHDHRRKYRIWIDHWRCPRSIDQLSNFDDLQSILNTFFSVSMLVLASKSSSCNHIWADGDSGVLSIEKKITAATF